MPRQADRGGAGSKRSGTEMTLQLLGKFSLVLAGQNVPVGAGCQRLLALVALNHGHVSRRHAAGALWPEVTTERANANLRSVLWRLQQCSAGVLEPSFADLHLAKRIEVDVHNVVEVAHRLIARSVVMESAQLSTALQSNLTEDLLPDMDDDWLTAERTRHRQLRLHSLEILSERLIEIGWYGAAVDLALAAVRADPFRESAHQSLIKAYLAEGNQNEAYQQFRVYENILREELGLEPSTQLHRLLQASGKNRRAA
jgi:DNA-binding SARP family transcriptional activator